MEPVEKRVDIGGGLLSLYVKVNGSGRPPVVFEAGLGDDSTIWRQVEAQVLQFTTTIVYDRAGLGRSSKVASTPTLSSTVTNLNEMLSKLDAGPNYIFVGHSIGGLLIRLYASRYRESVAGLILIDAPHEHQTRAAREVLTSQAWSIISAMWSKNREGIDLVCELERIEEIVLSSAIPVTALVATQKPAFPPEFPADIVQEITHVTDEIFPIYQQKLVAVSSSGQLIKVPNAGHYIHMQQPERVVAAIRSMMNVTPASSDRAHPATRRRGD